MKKLMRSVLFLAIVVGTTSPSLGLIHKVVYHEHPALRRMKAECRAKKAAKKMQAKRSLFDCISDVCNACKGGNDCCECQSGCNECGSGECGGCGDCGQ